MRLSEAIRLGAATGPQVFGAAFGANGGSCALGAASIAMSGGNDWNDYWNLDRIFPNIAAPAEGWSRLGKKIAEMNDKWKLTRNEIADWIVANGYDCESVELAPLQLQLSEEEVPVCV